MTGKFRGRSRRYAKLQGAIALGLGAALVLNSAPVFAFPETTSHRAAAAVTDAYPPTFIAERQSLGDRQIWTAESIFYRPPADDPASTPQGVGPVLREHPAAIQYRKQSVRQRMRDLVELLSPDSESRFSIPAAASVAPAPTRSIPQNRPTSAAADTILVDSGFAGFVLDIVEPTIEPGGVIAMTIQGLGRFALMFSRDTESIVLVDMDQKESFRMSEGRDLSFGAGPLVGAQLQSGGTQAVNRYGPTSSTRLFLRKIRRLAITILTHPGFIALAFLGIGLLVLRRLSRQGG